MDIEVIHRLRSQLNSEIVIIAETSQMEAVTQIQLDEHSDLDSEVAISQRDIAELNCAISIVQKATMESIAQVQTGGQVQIETEMIIRYIDISDLNSEIYVVAQNNMAVVADAKGNNGEELESEITVCYNARKEFDSEIVVVASATFVEAMADCIRPIFSSIETELLIVFSNESELDSEIVISSKIGMKVICDALNGGMAELNTEIYPAFLGRNELELEMIINGNGTMEAAVFYRNDVYADLDSEIALAVDSQLNSEIYIVYQDDKTVMEVAARTMPIVLKTGTTSAIKDAVCYSYTALTNYGTLPEVSVGRFTGGETFKGLIGFNLAELAIPHDDSMNYFGYETIQKATLKLYVTRPMVEDNVQIKIYRVSDGWFENKVNYRALDTLPVYEQIGGIIAPKKMGDITIDITPGFKDWAHKADRQSFMLVVENPIQTTKKGIYFSSREGFKAPRLEIEFYKPLPSGDWMDTDSEVFVNPHAKLDCEISITNPNNSEIDCGIDIAMQGVAEVALEVDLDILSNNLRLASLDSEIEIIGYPDEAQLNSECFVMFWLQDNLLDSEMDVVRDPNKGCYVYIM
ncbi:MAG: hypothetical protein K0R18_2609, partial [Bacillales bacterium]|nr:hypothetical protein [Bacillales bacterium]